MKTHRRMWFNNESLSNHPIVCILLQQMFLLSHSSCMAPQIGNCYITNWYSLSYRYSLLDVEMKGSMRGGVCTLQRNSALSLILEDLRSLSSLGTWGWNLTDFIYGKWPASPISIFVGFDHFLWTVVLVAGRGWGWGLGWGGVGLGLGLGLGVGWGWGWGWDGWGGGGVALLIPALDPISSPRERCDKHSD